MDTYAFQGGTEGASRLQIIDQAFGPHSRSCLLEAGLREGTKVLEVGCGTGSMTSWIARTVGSAGSVLAIDADPRQVELARAVLAANRATNVELRCGRVPDVQLPEGTFDLVYARLVLMHIRHPEAALAAMVQALRPGGVVVCEEAASTTAFAYPPKEAVARTARLFEELGRRIGAAYDIGDRLYDLVRAAGCEVLRASFVQPIVSLAVASRFLLIGANEVRPLVLKTGLLTEQDADELMTALGNLATDEGYYAFARVAQVIGKR